MIRISCGPDDDLSTVRLEDRASSGIGEATARALEATGFRALLAPFTPAYI